MQNVTFSVRDELTEAKEFGVLIPVEVRVCTDGSTHVSCYPQVETAVRAVLLDVDEPLSEDTLCRLADAVRPFAANYHTAPEPYQGFHLIMFEMEALQMPCMLSEGELRPLTAADFAVLQNKTEYEPDFDARMMGVVLDGAICAVAAENPYMPEEAAEINVFCAPGYRGRGFATACVSGLTRMLFADGVDYITYCCESNNLSSVHVAEKAGFTRKAAFYSVLCYLED